METFFLILIAILFIISIPFWILSVVVVVLGTIEVLLHLVTGRDVDLAAELDRRLMEKGYEDWAQRIREANEKRGKK